MPGSSSQTEKRMGLQACHQQPLYTIHTRVRVWLSDLGIPKGPDHLSIAPSSPSLRGRGEILVVLQSLEWNILPGIRLEENMVHFGITDKFLICSLCTGIKEIGYTDHWLNLSTSISSTIVERRFSSKIRIFVYSRFSQTGA